ncbi:MAG TPA: entericidin A/B family lipoprotein [Aquabacterium sp.]|nr:entericidin A/B family lipoprotein [Aquabacterium sp.]HET6786974.1 entericidin A/B family lipoprotein [Aquabacterium sp.]HEX5372149.1 entericidin A/B family lipoprotein [Aquabacterium sp.]
MKRIVFLMAAVAVVALTGCNTMHGMGQDIQKAGDAISGASKK